MANTEQIYYNAVRNMDRNEMMNYIYKYAETGELKVLLNTFDVLRKSAILDNEMKETLIEAENHLREESVKKEAHEDQVYLKKLEGRIMMLILKRKMAQDLKDNKLLFSISQQFNALLIEYKLEGGENLF